LLQAEFASAAVVVFRLCPSDYHRFHFPATGTVSERWEITGRYESVNPLVFTKGIPVYQENWRRVTRAVLDVAGPCLLVEIGAFGVAGIVETHGGDRFARMQEKGYFKFGGSTILLAFQAHRVAIAEDLVANTDHGFETRILAGQPIATLRST
jgi:phosphatidylserine decarboxylase